MIAELRRLARSRPHVWSCCCGEGVPPMPEGWYPHEPGDPFFELDWVSLHEHPEVLRRRGVA